MTHLTSSSSSRVFIHSFICSFIHSFGKSFCVPGASHVWGLELGSDGAGGPHPRGLHRARVEATGQDSSAGKADGPDLSLPWGQEAARGGNPLLRGGPEAGEAGRDAVGLGRGW